MRRIGSTDLTVSPLCLGGNVLGWTADEAASFAVLDAYAAAGGNFIDTADSYSHWVAGNRGGESETIIGAWLRRRGRRDDIVLATKVGMSPTDPGLSRDTITRAIDGSLRRLGTDHVDLYYAHRDDPATPLEETLETFAGLIRAGKVRHVGASNYDAPRLRLALETADELGVPGFVALQPHYNLVERDGFEGGLQALCAERGLGCLPYYALAEGFLTGKYRPGASRPTSERADDATARLDARGVAVLAALDEVAARHGAPLAAVALAWLAAQPTVVAPIASARTPEQLADLLPVATLALSAHDLAQLDDAAR